MSVEAGLRGGGLQGAAPEMRQLDDTERAFRRNLLRMIVVGVLALFVLMLASILLFQRQQAAAAWVEHTYAAETKISNLDTSLERLETARRGYIIERAPVFLSIYTTTRAQLAAILDALARFTADNPSQVRRLREVRRLIAIKLVECDATTSLVRAGDSAGAARLFAQQRDLHVAQSLRAVLADANAEENALLAQRVGGQARLSFALLFVSVGVAALLIGLAFAGFVLTQRYAAAINRSQEDLRRLNEGLERAVRERTAELTRANEEIQRFAYIVSHDLRSPLVNVMGFTSELEIAVPSLRGLIGAATTRDPSLVSAEARRAVEEEIPEAIGFIRASTQKMDRLINAILKLSRQGRRTLAPEPLIMTELLRNVVDTMRQSIVAREAVVIIDPDLPDLVGDRLALEQLFSNLVENAVKYLKPGRPGRVSIEGRLVGPLRVYDVQDNGRGIDTKDQERVFDLFRRAGAQDQPGEGIGLAHVRALVYRLGGKIELESRIDEGSRFRVSLPSLRGPTQGIE